MDQNPNTFKDGRKDLFFLIANLVNRSSHQFDATEWVFVPVFLFSNEFSRVTRLMEKQLVVTFCTANF